MNSDFSAKAFEQALYSCWEALRAQARRWTGSLQEAEDLVQEALAKAYSAWPNFRGEASFATWVNRIMANVHKDQLTKNSRVRLVSLDSDWGELPYVERALAQGEDISRRLELLDLRLSISNALAGLPQHYQRLLVLKYVKQWSYEELAQAFECSIESVRCRLYRARLEMRRLLAAEPV